MYFDFRIGLGLLLVLAANPAIGQVFEFYSNDPDINRNTTQLLESRGFLHEVHHPLTTDGYILTLVRIINPYHRNRRDLRPIYFQHGLFGNSDDFILTRKGRLIKNKYIELPEFQVTNCTGYDQNSVGQSLALVLATCGYDVWLGNYRGNRYSSRHILLNPRTDNEFWSFSVDELSMFDVTANIEYILSKTGKDYLGYVGHSLGTSAMFQLLSNRPEYSRHIKPFIALAPVAHVGNIKALLLQFAAHLTPYIQYLGDSNMPFFGMTSDYLSLVDQLIATFICGNSLLKPICTFFLFSLCGFDSPNTDESSIPFAFGHFPDGTSSRVLAHLGQRVVRNDFSFFDYGTLKNMKLYNSATAPSYNLSMIDSRYIILVSGINDYLADPTDIDILRSKLTVPLYRDYVVPYPLFNHDDFLIGNNVGKYQNSLILRWLQEIYAEA